MGAGPDFCAARGSAGLAFFDLLPLNGENGLEKPVLVPGGQGLKLTAVAVHALSPLAGPADLAVEGKSGRARDERGLINQEPVALHKDLRAADENTPRR